MKTAQKNKKYYPAIQNPTMATVTNPLYPPTVNAVENSASITVGIYNQTAGLQSLQQLQTAAGVLGNGIGYMIGTGLIAVAAAGIEEVYLPTSMVPVYPNFASAPVVAANTSSEYITIQGQLFQSKFVSGVDNTWVLVTINGAPVTAPYGIPVTSFEALPTVDVTPTYQGTYGIVVTDTTATINIASVTGGVVTWTPVTVPQQVFYDTQTNQYYISKAGTVTDVAMNIFGVIGRPPGVGDVPISAPGITKVSYLAGDGKVYTYTFATTSWDAGVDAFGRYLIQSTIPGGTLPTATPVLFYVDGNISYSIIQIVSSLILSWYPDLTNNPTNTPVTNGQIVANQTNIWQYYEVGAPGTIVGVISGWEQIVQGVLSPAVKTYTNNFIITGDQSYGVIANMTVVQGGRGPIVNAVVLAACGQVFNTQISLDASTPVPSVSVPAGEYIVGLDNFNNYFVWSGATSTWVFQIRPLSEDLYSLAPIVHFTNVDGLIFESISSNSAFAANTIPFVADICGRYELNVPTGTTYANGDTISLNNIILTPSGTSVGGLPLQATQVTPTVIWSIIPTNGRFLFRAVRDFVTGGRDETSSVLLVVNPEDSVENAQNPIITAFYPANQINDAVVLKYTLYGMDPDDPELNLLEETSQAFYTDIPLGSTSIVLNPQPPANASFEVIPSIYTRNISYNTRGSGWTLDASTIPPGTSVTVTFRFWQGGAARVLVYVFVSQSNRTTAIQETINSADNLNTSFTSANIPIPLVTLVPGQVDWSGTTSAYFTNGYFKPLQAATYELAVNFNYEIPVNNTLTQSAPSVSLMEALGTPAITTSTYTTSSPDRPDGTYLMAGSSYDIATNSLVIVVAQYVTVSGTTTVTTTTVTYNVVTIMTQAIPILSVDPTNVNAQGPIRRGQVNLEYLLDLTAETVFNNSYFLAVNPDGLGFPLNLSQSFEGSGVAPLTVWTINSL
jgi:hypothetical protein